MLEFRLNSINIKPAMTYSRAGRTTIGPRCLSAVFGMGTGGATRVCSPASRLDISNNLGSKKPQCL